MSQIDEVVADRFFEGCLQRIEEQRMLQALPGNPRPTQEIEQEMKANRGLTAKRMSGAGGVSRASFYRFNEVATTRRDRNSGRAQPTESSRH